MRAYSPSHMKPGAVHARGLALLASNDEPEICGACNGSGEGMFDGSRCNSCGGSGVERARMDRDDGPDPDDYRTDPYREMGVDR